MELVNAYILLATNVGGFGVLAFVLWRLHERQLATFAAELREERNLFRSTLEELRVLRDREHRQGMRRLDTLAAEVKRLGDLWEK